MTTEPDWAMLLQKSKENLEVAAILYERRSYGLAAYHAQQSIETLFKSFVYQILRKHEEYDRVKLYAHLPLIDVIGIITNFVKKIESKIDETKKKARGRQGKGVSSQATAVNMRLKEIAARSQAMKETLEKIKEIIGKLERRGKQTDYLLKEDIWKYSMDLQIRDDSQLNKIISAANEYGAEPSQGIFMEDMIYVAQVVFSDDNSGGGSLGRNDIDKAYLDEIKPLISHALTSEGFPSAALDKILNYKALDDSDRAEMMDFVIKKGELHALSMFFSSAGLMSLILEVVKRHYTEKTYKFIEKYFDLQRVSYAASICSTLVLLFPHESYGRYPENIAIRGSGATTTEAIYSEKSAKIYQYIQDCKKAYDHVTALM